MTIDIWDANAKALIIYLLMVIAFLLTWKVLGPGSRVDKKKRK